LAAYAEDDVPAAEVTLRPQFLERVGNGGLVAYLSLDDGSRGETDLGETLYMRFLAVYHDLGGSYRQ
jgi:hypothetical protein